MELSQHVKRLKNYQPTQILPENPEGGESSPDYFLLTFAYVRPPCNKIQKGKEIKIIKFLNTYLMISKIFQNPDENKCSNQEEFINKSKCVSYGCDHNNLKK